MNQNVWAWFQCDSKKSKKERSKKREEDRRKIINMNSFDDTIELNYLSMSY
jgi:hypothetical protein